MGALLTAMGLVFVAELGDKTQLVAFGMGARHRLTPVLVGVTLGYAATNLLSVVVGGLLGAALPTRALGLGGGVLFLAFAAWSLRDPGDDGADTDTVPSSATGRVVVAVAVSMFVAELGDKTMLTTATLAAQDRPALVWVGATIGIVASGFVGVLAGRLTGRSLPGRHIRLVSSGLFAVVGVFLVVTNL